MSDVPRSLNVDQWAISGSLMAQAISYRIKARWRWKIISYSTNLLEKNPRRIFWVPLEISRTGVCVWGFFAQWGPINSNRK